MVSPSPSGLIGSSPNNLEADAAPGHTSLLRSLMKIGWNLLPPLTFIAIVGAWDLIVRVFKVPAYLLPAPGPVFQRLITDAGLLWSNSLVTLTEIVLGF